jgi:hypothetical protein
MIAQRERVRPPAAMLQLLATCEQRPMRTAVEK